MESSDIHREKVEKLIMKLQEYISELKRREMTYKEGELIQLGEIYSEMDSLVDNMDIFINGLKSDEKIVEEYQNTRELMKELTPYMMIYMMTK